ncbi:efflux RND transporter periplasmic adaptor subunit [Kordiimonas marina]|uniref:efflux RND transporter periplasmic adaptor subunit n=1 Tax=Kordiimonas marina TaxID=2872312 RepID=UPI001FF20CDE|nr:efflux RND transporter periplasmic adaptor subunit [Kordiimonas marina]MCJ9428053.1 efflux RND transporter periplasmic adaptor subunit [Kordiimonas marina]
MRKILIFAAIIIGIVVMAVVAKRHGGEAVAVRMEAVSKGRVAASVMASGKVNFRENIKLRTEVTGRITKIFVEEGDHVKAGDTLAIISPELFEADVAQAKALVETRTIGIERQEVYLKQLQRELKRQKALFEDGHVNEQAYEQASRDTEMAKLDLEARRQDLQQAKATLSSADDRLHKTVIKSPIDGIVTALNVKVGETVVAGTTNIIGSSLMDVSDPSAVMAEVEVEEADILPVALGQNAKITMASAPGKAYDGKVVSIATTAREDASKRNSFLVKLLVDTGGTSFKRLAINCRAEIFTKVVENAMTVPVEAVLEEKADDAAAAKSYVFTVKDGIAKKQVITPGIQTDTLMEVKSGLKAGEKVVTGPYRKLKALHDGESVKPEEAKKAEGEDDSAVEVRAE